jgi:hypothetical protein
MESAILNYAEAILIVDDSAPVLNSVRFVLESVPDWVVGFGAPVGLSL